MRTPTATTLLALVAGAAPALAQVRAYSINEGVNYLQTGEDSPPKSPINWTLNMELQTVVPGDAAATVVTFSGPRSPFALTFIPGQPFGLHRRFGGSYVTKAALDADFPPGPYTFTVSGGTIGVQADSLNVPLDVFPAVIPYLSGDSFTRLQSANATVPFTGAFPPFTIPSGADRGIVQLTISRGSGQPADLSLLLTPADSSFTIPPRTLDGNTSYILRLVYTAYLDFPARFPGGTASGRVAFVRATAVDFTTTCDADFNTDHTVNSTDVSDFINQWFNDLAEGTLTSDFDANGVVNSTDVSSFINVWFEESAGQICGG